MLNQTDKLYEREFLTNKSEDLEMKKRPLILAVDDCEPMLRLLRVNLSLDGFDVVTATNGISALELLEQCKPELVLLDIMMPGLDGFQVLNLIRQHCNVPVVILTTRCEKATLRDALASGADDYVTKPFSVPELEARIRAKLRRTEAGAVYC